MLRMRRMVGGRRFDSDWSTVLVALNSMAAPVVVRMRMTLRSIRFMLYMACLVRSVVTVVDTRTRAPSVHGTSEEEQDSPQECGNPQSGASTERSNHKGFYPSCPEPVPGRSGSIT